MAHGNGGQAEQRSYMLSCLPPTASLYVVEYPGYGLRAGTPSAESLNAAVAEAYAVLLARFPHQPIGVIGESLGSGPASLLARSTVPPRKIVLIVPFDNLASVAAEHVPLLPARWLLKDRWDNVSALRGFHGPIDVYGAKYDTIIPVRHAERLAERVGAKFTLMLCGHNDWSSAGVVHLE
jgi:surfactin synthase thioesterase subunit